MSTDIYCIYLYVTFGTPQRHDPKQSEALWEIQEGGGLQSLDPPTWPPRRPPPGSHQIDTPIAPRIPPGPQIDSRQWHTHSHYRHHVTHTTTLVLLSANSPNLQHFFPQSRIFRRVRGRKVCPTRPLSQKLQRPLPFIEELLQDSSSLDIFPLKCCSWYQ